jgi:hypothetical protein
VPSTTWLCECQFFCYAKLANEAQAEAVTLVVTIWLEQQLPVMNLAKHFFASLRDTQQDPTMHDFMHWQ